MTKNFVVKHGLTTGNITLSASDDSIAADSLTLTGNISVFGLSELGDLSNVKISGGNSGQFLTTDGTGNLSFANVVASSSTPAPMPTLINAGDTVTIPSDFQGLFAVPITVNGTLEIDGTLSWVDGATIQGNGNITIPNLNSNGTISSNLVRTKPMTVSSLPSASVVGAGTRAFVTDCNTTTFMASVGSGGSNAVPVFSNGTNWLVG